MMRCYLRKCNFLDMLLDPFYSLSPTVMRASWFSLIQDKCIGFFFIEKRICNVRMKKIKSQQVVIDVYQKKEKNHRKKFSTSLTLLQRMPSCFHCLNAFSLAAHSSFSWEMWRHGSTVNKLKPSQPIFCSLATIHLWIIKKQNPAIQCYSSVCSCTSLRQVYLHW